MSPEQAAGERELDPRADIYSLGCVLYEMLAGEPPFTGPNQQAVLAKKWSEPVPRLGIVRDVSRALEQAVTRSLARAAADRFATAAEFAAALDAARSGATLAITKSAEKRGVRIAIVAATLLLVLAGGYLVVRRTGGREAPAASAA